MSKDSLYKTLRHVPGYFVGDPLRKADGILCFDLDLTAYALEKLRPGDAAFVRRSNGSFTYSVYQGPPKNNENELSFRVDDRGRFKTLPKKHFSNNVKVPALPRVLLENKALAAKYLAHKEEDEGTTVDEVVSRTANDEQLSRPTAKPEFNISDSALEKYHFNIAISSSLIKSEVMQRKSESQQPVYQGPKQTEKKNCVKQPCCLVPQEVQRQEARKEPDPRQVVRQHPKRREKKNCAKQPYHRLTQEMQQQEVRSKPDPPGSRDYWVLGANGHIIPRHRHQTGNQKLSSKMSSKGRQYGQTSKKQPLENLLDPPHQELCDPRLYQENTKGSLSKTLFDANQGSRHLLHVCEDSTWVLHEKGSLECPSQEDCSKVGSRCNSSQDFNTMPHNHLCEKFQISGENVTTMCSSTQGSTVTH